MQITTIWPKGVIPDALKGMLSVELRRFLSRSAVMWFEFKGPSAAQKDMGPFTAHWDTLEGHHFSLVFAKITHDICLVVGGTVDGEPLSQKQIKFMIDRLRAEDGG
jgi:hypothetical protein